VTAIAADTDRAGNRFDMWPPWKHTEDNEAGMKERVQDCESKGGTYMRRFKWEAPKLETEAKCGEKFCASAGPRYFKS
jgi:hypothetical protein